MVSPVIESNLVGQVVYTDTDNGVYTVAFFSGRAVPELGLGTVTVKLDEVPEGASDAVKVHRAAAEMYRKGKFLTPFSDPDEAGDTDA